MQLKSFYKCLLVITILLCNSAVAQRKSNEQLLDNFKNTLHKDPEQAKKYIDELLANKQKFNDTLLFDAYKAYALYYNSKGDQNTTLKYHTKALQYATSDPKRNVQGLVNIAETYRKLNNLKKASEALNEAEDISVVNDNVLLGSIYSIKGSNSGFLLNSEEGFQYLHKAIDLLKKEKDDAMLVYAQATLAGNYMVKKNYLFALDLYKEALEGYKKLNHWQNYYLTLINYSDCLLQTNQPNQVVSTLGEIMPKLETPENEIILLYALWKLADAEALRGKYKQSVSYYERAQQLAIKNNNDRTTIITARALEVLNKLGQYNISAKLIASLDNSNLYKLANINDRLLFNAQKGYYLEKVGKTAEALAVLKNVISISDSIHTHAQDEKLLEAQAQYQNELQRSKNIELLKENNNLQEKNAFEKKIFWLGFVIVAITISALGVTVALLRSRNRLQQESILRIDAKHQLAKQEHQNELQQNELLEQKLQLKNLALENAQLQIKSFIDDIENKNQVIKNMSDEFEKLSENTSDERTINDYKNQLDIIVSKAIVSDEKWDSFLKIFNAAYPDYVAKINKRLPNLTPSEMRFITLRKLNLSPRETATALGVQTDSLRLYKHRLRKKYEIQTDEQLAQLLDA